jgi:hypothetical protein
VGHQFVVEAGTPLAIQMEHPAPLARVVSLAEEIGEGHQFQDRQVDLGEATRYQQRVDETGRRDQVAEAK